MIESAKSKRQVHESIKKKGSLGCGDLLLPAPSQRLRGGVQPLDPPELTDSEGVEALGENTGDRK